MTIPCAFADRFDEVVLDTVAKGKLDRLRAHFKALASAIELELPFPRQAVLTSLEHSLSAVIKSLEDEQHDREEVLKKLAVPKMGPRI